MPFYAVARGNKTGVFSTWSECQEQINGFRGAVFKKFNTQEEAETFVQEKASRVVDKRKKEDSPSKDTETKAALTVPSETRCERCNQLLEENIALRLNLDRVLKKLKSKYSSSEGKRRHQEEDEASPSKKIKTESRNKEGFLVNADDFVIIYTDGSCEFNGRHGAKAGIGVFFGPKHTKNVSEPVHGRPTNNTAEIHAATRALEQAKSCGFEKVIIRTDSQFMINCITSWLPSWKKKDWKKSDGSEVKNKEDLMKLDAQTEGLLIKWEHVKAHDGEEGNESADKLAKEGAKSYKLALD